MGEVRSRAAMILLVLTTTTVFLGLAVLGYGRGFFASPARTGVVLVTVASAIAALGTDVNLSTGRREDAGNRWILAPLALGTLAFAILVPYLDRRDLWTIDGDVVRDLGLALTIPGSVLRVWPMYTLGRRFSGLVAIQPGHQLVTRGPYAVIRNPSYLGGLFFLVGWALVFRSGAGLLLVFLGMPLLTARIDAEERLLAAEFGDAYEAYRRRTWRLVPWVY